MDEPVRVRLELKSHPENVALVRAALSGLATAAELDEELTADLKTAVSEACNNVVLHAYDGQVGPMTVSIAGFHDGISVVVTDSGSGIRRISSGADHMGLGLAVISALADRSEFGAPQSGGTEVRMWFARVTAIVASTDHEGGPGWPERIDARLAGDVVAWLAPAELARFVLGRVFRAMAAAAHFSISRVSELYAVNDAIAEYVEVAADGKLGVAISSSSRRLSLTGGPFPLASVNEGDEDGARLPARSDERAHRKDALADVVDTFTLERINHSELLHLVLVDHGGGQD